MKVFTAFLMLFVCLSVAFGAEKEGVNNLLGEEVSQKSGWKIQIFSDYRKEGASIKFDKNMIFVNTASENENMKEKYYGQQVIKRVELEKNKTYILKFTTESSVDGKLVVGYVLDVKPYCAFFSQEVLLKSRGIEEHSIKMTPRAFKGTYDFPRSLRLMCGLMHGGELVVNKITLSEMAE